MLIRINGGQFGIREYLETGHKRGRDASREQLDDRIPLRGDIDLLDTCIRRMNGTSDNYLHITIAFKEDHLDEPIYREILERFELFAFAAYKPEEYILYAEAHLPRLKSFIDRSTGRMIERKPHIHIVIPKKNLLSDGALNPFGMYYKTNKYINAFQEVTNSEFGLASPKEYRRTNLESESNILARYKGSLFNEAGYDLKEEILIRIIQKNIPTLGELERELQAIGEVKKRNAGKAGEYLNIKPHGAEKGVNLKEYVFSNEFLALPFQEKKLRLAEENPNYVERSSVTEPSRKHVELLEKWMEQICLEIKYLNSGNRKEYAHYFQLSKDDQRECLLRKAEQFYKKHKRPDFEIDTIKPHADESSILSRANRVETVPSDSPYVPILPPGTNPIQRSLDQRKESVSQSKLEAEAMLKEAKFNLDPKSLLAYAENHHGVIPGIYSETRSKDGSGRIQCGTRNLNAADFLTKELHLPWFKAADILAQIYSVQVNEGRQESSAALLWKEYVTFSSTINPTEAIERVERSSLQNQKFEELRSRYRKDRSGIRRDTKISAADRKSKLSLLQTTYLAEKEAILKEMRREEEIARAQLKIPKLQRFLEEREKVSRSNPVPESSETIVNNAAGKGDSLKAKAGNWRFIPLFRGLDHVIRINGAVDYLRNGKVLLRDTGRRVLAIQETDEALEACLRLAVTKFGPKVRVFGREAFKQRVAEVAARRGMKLTFQDPALERIRKASKTRDREQPGWDR